MDLFNGALDAGLTPVSKKKPPKKKKTDAPEKKNISKFMLPGMEPVEIVKPEVEPVEGIQVTSEKISAPANISHTAPQDTDRGNLKRAKEIFRMFGMINGQG